MTASAESRDTDDDADDSADVSGVDAEGMGTYSLSAAASSPGSSPAAAVAPVRHFEPRRPDRARSPASDFRALMGCNFVVFVTSVCIMVLELTASRLIAKHVGSSLYTWTSVIGVVLAGITVGNYMGGWLADRFDHRKTLAWLFFAASVLCFSVLWLDQIVPGIDKPTEMGWQWWVLCIVGGIFLLPAIAMGTISPVVASLALSRSARTGMTVGNVYAWGALGSIVGTFIAGFVLIDVFGTRAIVGMTAATLAAMGVLTAAGQWAYRATVLFGWLQFVLFIGLCAAARSDAFASAGHSIGRLFAEQPDDEKDESVRWWTRLGRDLGQNLHSLGMTLSLRDDEPGEYHDESNYSYINVANTTEEGDRIKYLKLDKLVHSYYNPANPTKLYYEYEKVYAAVTERAAARWKRKASTELLLPEKTDLAARLPEWARYDAGTKRLEITGAMSAARRDELLGLDPGAVYWKAVEELHRLTNEPNWGGFSSVPLASLPEGVFIPEPLAEKVRFDRGLEALIAYQAISVEDVARLVSVGPESSSSQFYHAVKDLYDLSRQVSTMFIGGGGFIFPRWVEAEFPHQPLIHVAELDPAVKLAVQLELGLPVDDQTFVKTFLGDARNFVDDRVAENNRLLRQTQPPLLYDFIYGDAFNDYSVPFHLTTREFTEKVKSLLHPREGVFLANIIDIYPHTAYPGKVVGTGEAEYAGKMPDGFFPKTISKLEWTRARRPYEFLEAQAAGNDRYRLRVTRAMKDDEYADLNARFDGQFDDALYELYQESNTPVALAGDIPAALMDAVTLTNDWSGCAAPFEGIEIDRIGGETFQIGVRGIMPDGLRNKLLKLDPSNQAFNTAVAELYEQSRRSKPGRFVSAYANTVQDVFPNVYVYNSDIDIPSMYRDTFVIVASLEPVDLSDLEEAGGYWSNTPFAWMETDPKTGQKSLHGQMENLLLCARGIVLTDDFAPVDNLLSPVFKDQN